MANIKVIDEMNGFVLPGANCVYLDASKNLIYVADIMTTFPVVGFDTTGSDGVALVPNSAGGKAIKFVKVSFVGFETQIVENASGAIVRLKAKSTLLDEVTITECKKYGAKNTNTGICEFSYAKYAKENQSSIAIVLLIIALIIFFLIHKF